MATFLRRSSRWELQGKTWVKVKEGPGWPMPLPHAVLGDPMKTNLFAMFRDLFREEEEWADRIHWKTVYDKWDQDKRFYRRATGHAPPSRLVSRMGKTSADQKRAAEYLESYADFLVWFKRSVLPWEKAGRPGDLLTYYRWISVQGLEAQLSMMGIKKKEDGSCGVK
jgi:hypothetical protein